MKKEPIISIAFVLFIALLAWILYIPPASASIKCIDGDTFAIGKTYYRLADIDTPERGQVNYKEASKFTCNWLKTNPAILEVKGLDKYGRTLVVVWKVQRSYTLANPGTNLNELLVSKCLAQPFFGKTNDTIMRLYNKCKKA